MPGRGIGLFAARDIAAGETVLSEQPLIVYAHEEATSSVCAFCLRLLDQGAHTPQMSFFTVHDTCFSTQAIPAPDNTVWNATYGAFVNI